MKSVTAYALRTRHAALLIFATIAVGLILRASDASEAASGGTNAPALSLAADKPLPKLPIVNRPPAQQPVVGLLTDTHLDKAPPRATKGLDLVKSGWAYNCMECHKLFPARWHYDDRPFNEHKDIKLDHGNNRFCLNCHHPTNRNAFVDYDSSEIAQAEVVKLCAKCHGTIHRDWQAGVHGRQNGFWNASMGDKTKLRCIQCHDPHSPKFKDMQPLAPLRYPARAAGARGDASSPQDKRDAHVTSPDAADSHPSQPGDVGVASTTARQGVAAPAK